MNNQFNAGNAPFNNPAIMMAGNSNGFNQPMQAP
jgi:hypothetical protein